MVASYGNELADKHAGDTRTLLKAEWYREVFPATLLERTRAEDLRTTAGGGRRAVSLGGAVTGLGADLIVIDDLMKAGDALSATARRNVQVFYENTLFLRLNDKASGAIVAIHQRLHEDDLAAYLMSKEGFVHLNLTAIAERDESFRICRGHTHHRQQGEALFPAREPLSVLAETRANIGEAAFAAQYQQNPVVPGGNRLRWEWVQTYDGAPPRESLRTVVQSWDTAFGSEPDNDPSVCTTWGLREDGVWLLLDVLLVRLVYPDLKARVIAHYARWGAQACVIERAGSGQSLLDDLRQERRGRHHPQPQLTLHAYQPRGDKETRFEAQTDKIKAGRVLFPRQAPWLQTLRDELTAFPPRTP